MTDNRIDLRIAVDTASAILRAAGLSSAAAQTVARSLVDADLRGIPSHGLLLVPMYIDRLRAGSVTTHERAEFTHDSGAIAVLDGRHAFGQLTGDHAMAVAIEKASALGVGLVTVRHAFHFGGAFRYVQTAAEHGCVGIAASNTRPLMPAPGGATRVVGNNPLAIGIPRDGHDPIVLDMAMSEAALGKIRLAEQEGRDIPHTWATDASGAATTNPADAIAGMLLPLGGPKGYGLALMIDILTGVLSGGSFGDGVKGMYADVSVPNDCAHVFLAVSVEAFGPFDVFERRVEKLAKQIDDSELAPGTERVYLPGQRESERAKENAASGVPLDSSVIEGLTKTAELVGVQLPEGWPQ